MTCIIGLDYGVRRTGIAASDGTGRFAFGVSTHVEGRDGSLIRRVADLVAERGAEAVVMGLPLRADGAEGEMSVRVRAFAGKLAAALDVPVELWDERFTSQEADRWLGGGAGRRAERRRAERDEVAAELILQGYLDARNAGGEDRT